MGVITNLRDRADRYALSWWRSERRAITREMLGIVSDTAASGRTVTEESAQRVIAVYAAIGIISDGVAGLPLLMYERDGQDKGERAVDHPLYGVLHDRFNDQMDAMVGRELMTSHLCAYGNAYAETEWDDRTGRMTALWPLRPDRMEVVSTLSGRGSVYVYTLDDGTRVPLEASRILHVRLRGDRLAGWSPIRMAREGIGLAMAAEEFAARFYANGAQPGVAIRHPGRLSKDAHRELKASWAEQHQGLANAHRAAILEEGMSIERLGIPPEDAQFLETRQFQVTEVARLYRVPPHMIGDVERSTSWGTGIEQQQLAFQQFTLRAYTKRWEAALVRQCLAQFEQGRYVIEHLFDALLQADTQSRFSAYASAVTNGWMTRNEVRRRENMPPGPAELDAYLTPVAVAQQTE